MFELRKSFQFEASHQLVHHDGKCRNLHGHSYLLTVELCRPNLITDGPQRNMVADFSDISRTVRKLVRSHLDHHHLNDSLETDSPTAEFIAHWCYYRLKPELPYLTSVEIRETATSSATYRPIPNCMRCTASTFHTGIPTPGTLVNGVLFVNGNGPSVNGWVNAGGNGGHSGQTNGIVSNGSETILQSSAEHLIDR